MKKQEGKITVDGQKVWYRRVGESKPGRPPLLCLHGGPGAGHDYLEPLEGLASDREVVFYDQLGCGRSDRFRDKSLIKVKRFVAEVDTVRKALGLERIHLLGQSWGGWLAIEYMTTASPQGVVGLILASTSSSIAQFVAEAERLKSALPAPMPQVLQKYEAAMDLHNPEYEKAVLEFYKRHLCRLDPWPDCIVRSAKNMDRNLVYETLNGPNEFMVIGELKDWDRTSLLGRIKVPTLITVGGHDELPIACSEAIHKGIPGSRVVVFEKSAHCAHLEETEKYNRTVAEFLQGIEDR